MTFNFKRKPVLTVALKFEYLNIFKPISMKIASLFEYFHTELLLNTEYRPQQICINKQRVYSARFETEKRAGKTS